MLSPDRFKDEIEKKYRSKIEKGAPLIIRDEKTASGRVHVGSLRGVAIHGVISEVLNQSNIENSFLFEINDFDPMDALPVYLDQEKFKDYMGRPLCAAPSPDGSAPNYAEYFALEFIGVINEIGFKPKFYRASDLYRQGKFNDAIKIALEKRDKIKEIYKRVSGAERGSDWHPLNVVCEKCGKIGTTKVIDFDGKEVEYTCDKNYVEWAEGCGYEGKISPFNGNAKLPWKVEWAAKFLVYKVDVEGGGKDHSTKGGAREIADAIAREVYEIEPPLNIPYEFFHVSGKKMSSSKGSGSSSREIADLLPPHILRLLLLQKEPQKIIDFIPDGDTVPVLFDTYDKHALNFWNGVDDDYSRLFSLIHIDDLGSKKRFLPRFREVAYIMQMPHLKLEEEFSKMAGQALSRGDLEELKTREKYARVWLDKYAPEDYKFTLQKEIPEEAKNLSEKQKEALEKVLLFIKSKENIDGQEMHTALHNIRQDSDIDAPSFFKAIYLAILGKESGPKAGWFLSVLDREFLIQRISEIANN